MFIIARDPVRARIFFSDLDVTVLPAPFQSQPAEAPKLPRSYFQILHSVGYYDKQQIILGLISIWKNLFKLIGADLILVDHAPTAVFAAGALQLPVVSVSVGFCMPDPLSHDRDLRPWIAEPMSRSIDVRVEQNIVAAATHLGMATVGSAKDAVLRVEHTYLRTVAELDPFAPRLDPRSSYAPAIGADSFGEKPRWLCNGQRRLIAYLKPFRGIEVLFSELNRRRLETIVFLPAADSRLRDTYQSEYLRFMDQPADLLAASQEVDFAILNGTHASALRFLLAGKPALHIPIVLEQRITAERIACLGCGLAAMPGDVRGICLALDALCHESSFATQAQRFTVAHQPWQKPDETDIVDHLLAIPAAP